ncbi:MAG: T9SS type A sorting domain-containing protein [Chitinophagaceae bacterium]|nr:T9SS type A sorting domain-containing protein [Chitinophagaceae bacterium]
MKKKPTILLASLLLSVMLFAQDNITYTKMADSLLFPVSKSQITTGILYDRVMPFAGLHAFNNTDTSSYLHFFQAYSELYSAAYSNGSMMNAAQIDTLSNAMYYTNNVIPVGVLYYDFNLIDTLAIANNLFYKGPDSLLHDVPGRTGNPFKLKTITVAAALSQDTLSYGTGNITFKYVSQLFLTNKAVTITSIYADFGSGNQNLTSGNNVTVFYPTSGQKTIKFTITYSNAQTVTVYSKIFLSSPPVSGRFGEPFDPDVMVNIDDIAYGYKGYGEAAKIYNSGEYGIYYHRTSPGGPKEMILKKPIIILDGFDPLEARKIRDLYGVYLQYTSSANFGKEMLDLGYDVIVVNFPNKPETKSVYIPGIGTLSHEETRVQGADFIQRNAFLLVTLIEKINQQLAANGSSEKLIVIGPSMGGLISRYALRWMELNGKDHNTKLWISFDAPHKGANIPIGDQYFIDFYASKLKSESAKDARDNSLNSPAARQMLLHHFTANSTTPAGAPDLRNNWQTELDNLGYPQNLRKVALINGAINGTTQGTACQNVYKLKVNAHVPNVFLLFVQIIRVTEGNIWFTGNNGNACEVFKGWTGAPFISNSKSAAAPSSSKSYDIAPGGYYDAQAQLGGSNIKFSFLFGKLYKPSVIPTTGYFGMWTETQSQILNPNHCFIPTFSALGMNITNKDLSENLYNRDLTCTGETPFDAYYAPLVNQEHITLTAENVAWIKEEIAGNKQMSSVNYAVLYPLVQTGGADPVCTNATFQINNLPSGSSISWQSSNPSIATVSATGNPVTLTQQGTQSGAITLTATIARPCSESNVVMTKTITVGAPSCPPILAQRFGSSCYYDPAVTLSAPGTIVEFSFDNVNWFAGTQSGSTFRAGSGSFLGPTSVMVYARTSNACGKGPVQSKNLSIPQPPGRCLMSQPPAASRTTAEQLPDAENEPASVENISVHPNPAGSKLTIVMPPLLNNAYISIYNAEGKLMHTGRLNSATNELNISAYRAGLYLVHIYGDGLLTKSVKIIKQ